MPAAIPVILEDKSFASQNKARLHFSEMLNRYRVGQTVSEADKLELQSLLKRHPYYNGASPVRRITVTKSGFGRDCFAIVRPDQSLQRLSFIACIRQSVQSG